MRSFRLNEVFNLTTLASSNVLNGFWEFWRFSALIFMFISGLLALTTTVHSSISVAPMNAFRKNHNNFWRLILRIYLCLAAFFLGQRRNSNNISSLFSLTINERVLRYSHLLNTSQQKMRGWLWLLFKNNYQSKHKENIILQAFLES